jgi:exodeoxyribonuclease VII large subunit
MFAGNRSNLMFRLTDGKQVIVYGTVDVYEKEGKYQLYAKEIKADGAGVLYEEFVALQKRLNEMGMFAPEYKQPIPRYINTLGIVTSPTGAVLHDIISIAKRRNPYVRLLVYPAIVQGVDAAASIVKGIAALTRANVDLIIVGRGGGSIEDLWAFNEEIVAQAVFDCMIPIISAVGHETDTTIIDFVADMRAPTPSAAAELAIYSVTALEDELAATKRQLRLSMERRLETIKYRMLFLQEKMHSSSPLTRIREKRSRAITIEDRLQTLIHNRLTTERHYITLLSQRLESLSPHTKLGRGYAYIENEDKHSIKSVAQVSQGDKLRVYLPDGQITSIIDEIITYTTAERTAE